MSGNKVILNVKSIADPIKLKAESKKINMQVLPPQLTLSDVERAERAALEAEKSANSAAINAEIAQEAAESIGGNNNAFYHNCVYRGKNFGTISADNIDDFLTEHEVQTGKFTDLYLGDEITIQDGEYNAVWLVAGFDTEYNKGDVAFTTHHITLVPKSPLFNANMNSSATTEGAYKGSDMHNITLPALASKLKTALGVHLLTHRCMLTKSMASIESNAISAWIGAANDWEWTDVECVLMSEIQLYGSTVWCSSCYEIGEANEKLPLFNYINPMQFARWDFWLRNAASNSDFCDCLGYGIASANVANFSLGVRPLICVG